MKVSCRRQNASRRGGAAEARPADDHWAPDDAEPDAMDLDALQPPPAPARCALLRFASDVFRLMLKRRPMKIWWVPAEEAINTTLPVIE